MNNFKKTLFFILFVYCKNLFASDLLEIRSGFNNYQYRVVLEFSDEIIYKSEISNNNIEFYFSSQISKTNLTKLKDIPNLKNLIFDNENNLIKFEFDRRIKIEQLFNIEKNKQNNNFRIVLDYTLDKSIKKKIVIIDAGHGGRDSGAIGRSKILEKDLTLKVAKKFEKKCKKNIHFECFLTRNGDYFMTLRKRVKFAREKKGDIFISLHADFHPKKNVRGVSIYTLSEKASDKEAEALARRENKSDLIEGLDLSEESKEVRNILIDLTQRETMNRSSVYVTELVEQFKKNTKLLSRTHRFAGFAVLKAPDIPSVLLEMGYLSNKNDVKLLTSDIYQEKIAENIYNATLSYFNK